MKLLTTIFSCIWIFLAVPVFQETKGWRRIVPLHSTRVDVERLLGPSDDPCKCVYRTDTESVRVEYASAPCKGSPSGWNVPPDTVLSFMVIPKEWQRFSDLNINEGQYKKTVESDNPTIHYTHQEGGIRYTVTDAGLVYYVSYLPSTRDASLRCPNFPLDYESSNRYKPFDYYSDIPFAAEKARLDNFAAWLHQYNDLTGYILVYGTRRPRIAREAQMRAVRAKEYLNRVRHVSSDRLVTIDGGYREGLEVELYALPSNVAAPKPYPTVAPSQVRIINNNGRKIRRAHRARSKRLSSN
jgi:hypothetical protein